MSLVLGFTDGKSAIIASDGRAGGTVCPSEEYDKTRKINNNIILGFVGYKESSEHFLNCVNMGLGERIKDCYVDEFLEVVKYGMEFDATKENLHSSFLVIGKTKHGDMKFILAGQNTNFTLKPLAIQGARLFHIGGIVSREKITDICNLNTKRYNGNIKNTMRDIIVDVSKIDNSINRNVYFQEIPYFPVLHLA